MRSKDAGTTPERPRAFLSGLLGGPLIVPVTSKHGLVLALVQASSLLRGVGEGFWAGKIDQMLKACGQKPSSWDAQKVLSWYGGMGSFNDLLISVVNGDDVRAADEKALNERLAELRGLIYAEASELARSG